LNTWWWLVVVGVAVIRGLILLAEAVVQVVF
jgi:hypothetical protein